MKTEKCEWCNKDIPTTGIFGLPTYTDVPENHEYCCPLREVMEVSERQMNIETERDGVVNNIVYNLAQDLLWYNRAFKKGKMPKDHFLNRIREIAYRILAIIPAAKEEE